MANSETHSAANTASPQSHSMTKPNDSACTAANGYFLSSLGDDSPRSSASSADLDGMAWAPAHMLTPELQRVPGSYMRRRSHTEDKLEITSTVKNGRASLLPLSDVVQEMDQRPCLSMLFLGRGLLGHWQTAKGCCGVKTKKCILCKLPMCSIIGITDPLERRLLMPASNGLVLPITEKSASKADFTTSSCTRVVLLPDPRSKAKPIDLSEYNDIKFKGTSRLRVEIVQPNGASLWLYNISQLEYKTMLEALSACRSYARHKRDRLEQLSTHPRIKNPWYTRSVPKLNLDRVCEVKQYQPSSAQVSFGTAIREAEALVFSQKATVTAETGHIGTGGPSGQYFTPDEIGTALALPTRRDCALDDFLITWNSRRTSRLTHRQMGCNDSIEQTGPTRQAEPPGATQKSSTEQTGPTRAKFRVSSEIEQSEATPKNQQLEQQHTINVEIPQWFSPLPSNSSSWVPLSSVTEVMEPIPPTRGSRPSPREIASSAALVIDDSVLLRAYKSSAHRTPIPPPRRLQRLPHLIASRPPKPLEARDLHDATKIQSNVLPLRPHVPNAYMDELDVAFEVLDKSFQSTLDNVRYLIP